MTEQLQKKIYRAIKLLQAYNDPDNPVEVAYSGGKDSDVILQLAKEAGINYRAIYKNTTIDPPGTIGHVREMGVEVLRPRMSFLHLVEKKGLPSRFTRFCCQELKEYKVLNKAIIGVRKAESRARNNRYNEPTQCRWYGAKTEKNHVEQILPILDWTDQDVDEYIKERGVKCAPLYYDDDGEFHVERRLGCMCCPLQSHNKRLAEFKKYPRMVKAYIRAAQKFLDTHPDTRMGKEHKGNAYRFFYRDVFIQSKEEWDNVTTSMFGEVDYKQFLEDYFNIKL